MAFLRRKKGEFNLVDGLILVLLMVIVSGTAVPIIESLNHRAKVSATLQNLHTLRSQIELYKIEHAGKPPLLYEGAFPQLILRTNEQGIPGPDFPLGPYLEYGVPVNPLTGGFLVTAVDTFPPTEPSGNGGWLYHQETGRITVDADGYLRY